MMAVSRNLVPDRANQLGLVDLHQPLDTTRANVEAIHRAGRLFLGIRKKKRASTRAGFSGN